MIWWYGKATSGPDWPRLVTKKQKDSIEAAEINELRLKFLPFCIAVLRSKFLRLFSFFKFDNHSQPFQKPLNIVEKGFQKCAKFISGIYNIYLTFNVLIFSSSTSWVTLVCKHSSLNDMFFWNHNATIKLHLLWFLLSFMTLKTKSKACETVAIKVRRVKY